jgi:DNA-directed RNA polymerase specialized sigma24 family protein
MLNPTVLVVQTWNLMGQAEPSPWMSIGPTEMDLWPYRSRTTALLRRYARASVEVGKLPSLLGGEIFRARLTSYSMKNFEDVVIFVADMEHSLELLGQFERRVLAMIVLEEYTVPEVSRLLRCSQRTVERQLQAALDELSRILLKRDLLRQTHNFASDRS